MALPIRKGATHKVVLGPAVAIANGYVPVTNLALSSADEAEVILHNNGTVVDISGYTWAAIATADGYYHLTLQTGISNTVGHMTVVVNDDSLCLPVTKDFVVMDAAAYDTLYATTATILTSADVGLMYESTIGTVTSQTEFIMDVAFASDNVWRYLTVSIEDVSGTEYHITWPTSMVQSTETIIVDSAAPFTVVVGDKIRVYAAPHPRAAIDNYAPSTAATLGTLVTNVRGWFRLLTRSDAGPTTDDVDQLTALNSNDGAGAGTYDPTTDSLEAGVTKVNGVTVTGSGTTSNPWGP